MKKILWHCPFKFSNVLTVELGHPLVDDALLGIGVLYRGVVVRHKIALDNQAHVHTYVNTSLYYKKTKIGFILKEFYIIYSLPYNCLKKREL